MMDWTDRHCRVLHRLVTRRTRLYTEMVTTGALLHGDVARHLDFSDEEHPLALQLGGSEPADLAHCARLAERWGYDEVNLNCGCPSERVQRGAFGACLMAEPQLVAEGVAAMREAVSIPVTVKHRIGIDREESYAFVRDFVGTVAERGGCQVFIVHARNAWLKGLSPKQNREVPPLRHAFVHRLKADFPRLTIVLNGGIGDDESIAEHLAHVDGVMVGRHAYHEPFSMARWDRRFLGADEAAAAARVEEIEERYVDYVARCPWPPGTSWLAATRHMMGLRNGEPGARRWRQVWSDAALRHESPHAVMQKARAAMAQAAQAAVGTPRRERQPDEPAVA
ncbi:MAG: tRNA dihydrouridine(20/20a) synthase DusA [Rubrivivax sp.]|nr:tRNA dihydrouridine(20/20a) synthase DusA [Rubrivivax sp.]